MSVKLAEMLELDEEDFCEVVSAKKADGATGSAAATAAGTATTTSSPPLLTSAMSPPPMVSSGIGSSGVPPPIPIPLNAGSSASSRPYLTVEQN